MKENVILVDKSDNEIGTEEKLKAHKEGKLHRAFSVFVFNNRGEMMLQKRAKTKYHSGSRWTNVCCSHPRPGEDVEVAAHRKLKQEMGFDCDLKKWFTYIYKAYVDNGLTEHEYLHVFQCVRDGDPTINNEEADDWKWISMKALMDDVLKNPKTYTPWFLISLERIVKLRGY